MALTADEITGLVETTQEGLIKQGAFVDAQTDITQHVAVSEMLPRHKKVFEGGVDWRFDVMLDHNHSARAVGLYERDGASIADNLVKGIVGPRFLDANYVFDTKEPDLQRGGKAIVDYVRTKYIGMIISFYDLLENILWSKPQSDADKKTPYGIPFWVTKPTVTTAGTPAGFNGGNPVGFSSGRAGLSSETYPRLKNYTGVYSQISKDDLLRTMRQCVRKTNFKSPVNHATPTVGPSANGIYTNDNVIGKFEEILEAQNMNLGDDLDSKGGKALFKGRPVTYVPMLDNDTDDPIYMLDWSTLCFGILGGWQKRVSAPKPVAGMHNVRQVFLDASLNTICTDFRKQTIIVKAAA